ncbi:type II toxin-antitoxin system PemK/MazF family toxin [Clostridium perfringens]|nr:type II toxin-antitoxin system PemK/MazF family toxin [Clostridium perfringens]NGU52733.1 type II toxin-antitoxin system PemK/MazF family toxin [Clostridium perfringens]
MLKVKRNFYKGKVYKGDIFYANLGKRKQGSEQQGIRPVAILKNFGSSFIVAPMTSQVKNKMKVHTEIENSCLEKPSTILLEQITTIYRHQLSEKKGTLTNNEIKRLNRALVISLGLI